jgi:hypothetical protein
MKRLVLLRLMFVVVVGMALLLFDVPRSYAWAPSVGTCPNLCLFVGCDCKVDLSTVTTVTNEDLHIVQSENDTQLAQCSGDITRNFCGNQAVVCDGSDPTLSPCTGGFNGPNSTTHWTEVITPSGEVVLTCHFKQP